MARAAGPRREPLRGARRREPDPLGRGRGPAHALARTPTATGRSIRRRMRRIPSRQLRRPRSRCASPSSRIRRRLPDAEGEGGGRSGEGERGALEDQVILDVWSSYYAVQTASQRVATTRDLLASAPQSADVARGRYKAGVGSILDLLTAQSALADARARGSAGALPLVPGDRAAGARDRRARSLRAAEIARAAGRRSRRIHDDARCGGSFFRSSRSPRGACLREGRQGRRRRSPCRCASARSRRRRCRLQIRNVGTVQAYVAVAVRALVSGRDHGGALPRGTGRPARATCSSRSIRAPTRPRSRRPRRRSRATGRRWRTPQTDVKRYEDLVKKDYVTQQQYDSVKANAAATAGDRPRRPGGGRAGAPGPRLLLDPRADRRAHAAASWSRSGNVVKANDATLVTINQIAPIYVTFAVPERELPEIRRRQNAGHASSSRRRTPASGRTLGQRRR